MAGWRELSDWQSVCLHCIQHKLAEGTVLDVESLDTWRKRHGYESFAVRKIKPAGVSFLR